MRDPYKQMVIDLMQLVRVIQVGMDVDGDAASDIDPTRIYYLDASALPASVLFAALDSVREVVRHRPQR